jgi:hypothetical protein
MLCAAFAVAVAGCIADDDPTSDEPTTHVEDEQDITREEARQGLTEKVGCDAIYSLWEPAWIELGFYPEHDSWQVALPKWEVKLVNPSDVACPSMNIFWSIVEFHFDTTAADANLTTSLGAHKTRRVWWNANFNSLTTDNGYFAWNVGFDHEIILTDNTTGKYHWLYFDWIH